MSTTDRPDLTHAEPAVGVYGLRTFEVSSDGYLAPLTDWGSAFSWANGTCVAACEKQDHPAPNPDCTCGLYTFKDTATLRDQYRNAETLIAVVALEGDTLEGSRGYRSAAGRVVAIWTDPDQHARQPRLDRLQHRYPTIDFHQDLDAMVARYPGVAVTPPVPHRLRAPLPRRYLTILAAAVAVQLLIACTAILTAHSAATVDSRLPLFGALMPMLAVLLGGPYMLRQVQQRRTALRLNVAAWRRDSNLHQIALVTALLASTVPVMMLAHVRSAAFTAADQRTTATAFRHGYDATLASPTAQWPSVRANGPVTVRLHGGKPQACYATVGGSPTDVHLYCSVTSTQGR